MSIEDIAGLISEGAFQKSVVELAEMLKWRVFHVPDSRKVTDPGWPDLVLSRNGTVLFRELKVKRNVTSPDQKYWLNQLRQSGADVAVWHPLDWDEIEETLRES